MKLVLFDCDGTLVDSVGLIHAVMTRTFLHFGHAAPDVEHTKAIIGLSLDLAIATMQGKPDVDHETGAMALYYKAVFAEVRAEQGFEEPLYDGIAEVIAAMVRRDDLLIGAVTGKSRRGLDGVLETHGLKPHFVVSRTADECPSKPNPAMVLECCRETGMDARDAVVIGDAIYDMQMGKAAGARAIGVSWGYSTTAALLLAGADAVVDRPADLLAHVMKGTVDA